MSAHYALCVYDDATGSYIPLASREEEILAAEEAGTRMLNRALEAEKQRDSFRDAAEYNKRRADDAERQRDDLLEAVALVNPSLDFSGWESADGEPIGEKLNALISSGIGENSCSHGSLGEDVGAEGEEA